MPMPSPYSRSRRCITLAASALLLTLPLAAMAETNPKPSKQQEEEQKEGYLRSLPYPKGPLEESDLIKMHSARMLYLLTYPTGVLPSEPWDKAKTHVMPYW